MPETTTTYTALERARQVLAHVATMHVAWESALTEARELDRLLTEFNDDDLGVRRLADALAAEAHDFAVELDDEARGTTFDFDVALQDARDLARLAEVASEAV